MAHIGCGASLKQGPGACGTVQSNGFIALKSPSARFAVSLFGVAPELNHIYASDRRLAGARLQLDLRVGQAIRREDGLSFFQAHGG